MTVTAVDTDVAALTMTITTSFSASIEGVWQLWQDPRKLERWWGPPNYPATVMDHSLEPEGRVTYFMTGPDGDKYHGWWRVLVVQAPLHLAFEDGFADDAGNANPDLPVTSTVVELTTGAAESTVMTIQSRFPSLAAMEQILAMGMEEGIRAALGQIDEILLAG